MNCQEFNDRLHEYQDETLGPEALAAARAHLGQCADCRRALLREQAVAQSIRHALHRATADLSLSPVTLRNVLKASESQSATPKDWMSPWQLFKSIPLRPVGVSVALVGVLFLILGIQIHIYRQAPNPATPPATVQTGAETCIIDVPLQTQTHLFRRQNNTVVDAIAPSVAMGHARFANR